MNFAVFDFDGTLTASGVNVWKKLWQNCGYETGKGSLYSNLYSLFVRGKISHQEWCDLTCQAFMRSGLSKEMVDKVASPIDMIGDLGSALNVLKKNGFSLHLVSGGVKNVILNALGENAKLFDSINANNFVFNENGKLVHIEETKYDYRGKADFVKNLKDEYGVQGKDICFIGNGSNDEWVYEQGCSTICINPDFDTKHDNSNIWNVCVQKSESLMDIVPYVLGTVQEKET